MINYLEKFKQLPEDLRQRISSPAVMASLSDIEKRYGVNLATVIMRIMVNDISLVDLPKFFVFENDMDGRQAEKLTEELKKNVLIVVADHLGIAVENPVATAQAGNQLNSWMQDRKDETAVRGSSFFFSVEDEEEVKNLAKKLVDYNVPKAAATEKVIDFDVIIDKVIKGINISFSSDDLRNRFRNVMTTYLRGIRSKVDTKQALIREVGSGGLGVSEIYADNIMLFTEKTKAEITDTPIMANAPVSAVPEIKKEKTIDIAAGNARDVDYDYKNMPTIKPVPSEKTVETPRGASVSEASVSDTPEPIKKEMIMPSITLDNKPEPIEPIKKEAIPINVNIDKGIEIKSAPNAGETRLIAPLPMRPRGETGKIKIEDVKHVPKLVGPLDELRELDLVNFRRIGVDPGERVRKIKDKITFLEEDSYGQRLAGIKAWRHSPVNTLYLDIGRESISTHQGIDAIINARRDSGKDYLTEEEFGAIMSLNKYLRY